MRPAQRRVVGRETVMQTTLEPFAKIDDVPVRRLRGANGDVSARGILDAFQGGVQVANLVLNFLAVISECVLKLHHMH